MLSLPPENRGLQVSPAEERTVLVAKG